MKSSIAIFGIPISLQVLYGQASLPNDFQESNKEKQVWIQNNPVQYQELGGQPDIYNYASHNTDPIDLRYLTKNQK